MQAKRAIAFRRVAGIAIAVALSCKPPTYLEENWSCDYDATEGRPLDVPDAPFDDAGALPASDCMNTCGTPVTSCRRITLDGAVPGALCPVCTF
jgi:hypothetical protein